MSQREAPEPFRDRHPHHAQPQQQHPPQRRCQRIRQHAHRHVGHQQDGQREREHRLERPLEHLIRHPRDVEQVVIAPHDALRPHRPETDRAEHEHQRVMDRDPRHAQRRESRQLPRRRMQMQPGRRHDHHAHREGRVDERAQIHLPRGDDEARVDGQRQQEIHLARAHQLRKVRAVSQEKRLIDLLDEVARAHQQHHLPFRPRTDGSGLRINDRDKGQLQAEPQQLHDDPEDEIALERHLPRHGILPQRGVNGQVAFQIHATDNFPARFAFLRAITLYSGEISFNAITASTRATF